MIYKDNIRGLSLEISDNVIAAIEKRALDAFPNETGGFLIGKYLDDNSRAYVSKVLIPKKCSSGPKSFQRETEGMEETWNKLYSEGLIYLGEWHSHPNGSCAYSTIDKTALTNIANCDTVVINNPIMLIVSLSKTDIKDISAYYYNNGNIVIYERE